MTSFVLSIKEFKGLCLGKAPAAVGVVLNEKIYKRLTNGHTYLNGLARVFPSLTATTLENGHFRRCFEYQVSC